MNVRNTGKGGGGKSGKNTRKGGKGKADDQIEREVSDDKNQEKEQKGLKESSTAAYSKGSNKTEAGENPSPKIDKKL